MKKLLLTLGLFISCISFAQSNWPEKSLKIIVPFVMGGPTDKVARIIAQNLSLKLGQTVEVQNMTGAGGLIAMNSVSSSPNDGYTLLLYISSIASQSSNEPSLDLISVISESPEILMVSPSLGVDSIAKFIAIYKSNPNQIVFGSIDGYSSSFINFLYSINFPNLEPIFLNTFFFLY
jgi:tripartite-type tricarboxylate transporter receptor subunit TctC